MIFVESRAFSRTRLQHMDDEEFDYLQRALLGQPDAGALIAGTGGLRKLRWAGSGRGKRGGMRVIYLHLEDHALVFFLLLYPKNVQDDLTPEQKRVLRTLVETEIRNLKKP